MKLSRIWSWLGGALLLVALGLLGFVIFVQTETGFRVVLAPAVHALGFGTIEAERGRVGLGGRIELEQGSYSWSEIGLDVRVEHLDGEISPMSLFEAGPIVIRTANVQGARVVVTSTEDAQPPAASGSAEATSPNGNGFDFPVVLEDAVVASTTVILRTDDGTTTIGPVDATAKNWKQNSKASLSLAGKFRTQTPGEEATTGRAKIDGTFETDSGALPKLWNVDLDVSTVFSSDRDAASTKLALKGSRQADGTTKLEAKGTLSANLPQPAGTKAKEVSLEFSQSAQVHPDGQIDATFDGRERRGAATVELSLHRPANREQVASLDVRIVNLDFEPFVAPFIDTDSPPAEPSPSGAEGVAKSDPAHAGSGSPAAPSRSTKKNDAAANDSFEDPFELSVLIEGSRMRDLVIGRFSAKISHEAGEFGARLVATNVAEGDARVKVALSRSGAQRLHGTVELSHVRLDPIMTLVGSTTSVDGKLTANGTFFSDAPASRPVLDGFGGTLDLQISDGKLAGFESLNLLAKATGISALGDFMFSRLSGGFSAREGIVKIKSLSAGGLALDLRATGSIDLHGAGNLDLTLNPRVGPEFASKAKGFHALARLLSRAENLLSLPVNVRITGPFDNPKTYVAATSLRQTVSTHGGALAGDVIDGASLGQAGKIISPLTGGLLGGKRDK